MSLRENVRELAAKLQKAIGARECGGDRVGLAIAFGRVAASPSAERRQVKQPERPRPHPSRAPFDSEEKFSTGL